MRKFLIMVAACLLLAACSAATPEAVLNPESQPTVRPDPTRPPASAVATQVVEDPGTSQPDSAPGIMDQPVLPELSAQARAVYASGQAIGRNPAIFSKIGDCMTTSPNFLIPFSTGDYDLGEYAQLQPIIDHYTAVTAREYKGQSLDSFANFSVAATEGFNSASVLEPLWANPAFCEAGESPLACEYRVTNPALALIMFGTNDVYAFEPDKFEAYLRVVIEETLAASVLPVLITFPPQPGLIADSDALNTVTIRLAGEYQVPLVNLRRALQDLPNYGIDPEQINHLTTPADGCMACFDEAHMESGIIVQNLFVLMALDEINEELGN